MASRHNGINKLQLTMKQKKDKLCCFSNLHIDLDLYLSQTYLETITIESKYIEMGDRFYASYGYWVLLPSGCDRQPHHDLCHFG